MTTNKLAPGALAASLCVLAALSGCVSSPPSETLSAAEACPRAVAPQYVAPTARAGSESLEFATLLTRIAPARAIYVGEIHDRYDHHLNQLAVICGLLAQGRTVAVGLEAFQVPFQSLLDAYVAGEIDEEELLARSEYYDRWRFDFRLYAPILRLARARGLALVALNAPAELTRAVARAGLEGLEPQLRAQLPASIEPGSASYRERLAKVYAQHPGHGERSFERFVAAQLVWDETMAERAAGYLAAHPDSTLVVVAGTGHVRDDEAIPARVRRRLPVTDAVLVPALPGAVAAPAQPAAALRFTLASAPLELAPGGRLGVYLEDAGRGMRIIRFTEHSAARDAGLDVGDRIVAINGRSVRAFQDVKLALWQASVGDAVELQVLRGDADTDERVGLALR